MFHSLLITLCYFFKPSCISIKRKKMFSHRWLNWLVVQSTFPIKKADYFWLMKSSTQMQVTSNKNNKHCSTDQGDKVLIPPQMNFRIFINMFCHLGVLYDCVAALNSNERYITEKVWAINYTMYINSLSYQKLIFKIILKINNSKSNQNLTEKK